MLSYDLDRDPTPRPIKREIYEFSNIHKIPDFISTLLTQKQKAEEQGFTNIFLDNSIDETQDGDEFAVLRLYGERLETQEEVEHRIQVVKERYANWYEEFIRKEAFYKSADGQLHIVFAKEVLEQRRKQREERAQTQAERTKGPVKHYAIISNSTGYQLGCLTDPTEKQLDLAKTQYQNVTIIETDIKSCPNHID